MHIPLTITLQTTLYTYFNHSYTYTPFILRIRGVSYIQGILGYIRTLTLYYSFGENRGFQGIAYIYIDWSFGPFSRPPMHTRERGNFVDS